MKHLYLAPIWNLAYNDNDAFIPEVWAQESLMILENNVVAANLVHRDFEDEIKEYGDIVNTRRPQSFTAVRKTDDDNVTDQAAISTNVQVPLDQWFHTSFIIKDGELSKSFKDLRTEYLVPGVQSLAQAIDEVVILQQYRFLANVAGKLGTAPTKATLIALKEIMSNNKCPLGGRNLIVNPSMEGDLLNNDSFTDSEKVGDDGMAMREGNLGRKFGFNSWMDQNAPSVVSAYIDDEVTSAAAGIGATAIGCVNSANFDIGQWVVIAGDNTPQLVTNNAGATLTITPGLRSAVLNAAHIYGYEVGAVNFGAGYLAGYAKEIVTNGFAPAPVKGQLATFLNSPTRNYGIMSGSDATGIFLDRPLAEAIIHTELIGLGPQGNYGFAFHRNAMALVVRPLALVPSTMGANSAVANYKGISLRITMQYDGKAQGLRVVLDILGGVAVLDTNLGAVLLG